MGHMRLATVAANEVRLLSIEGRKVRVLLKDDRVLNMLYESEEELDRELRDWAARAGYSVPNTEQAIHRGENDINGFGP